MWIAVGSVTYPPDTGPARATVEITATQVILALHCAGAGVNEIMFRGTKALTAFDCWATAGNQIDDDGSGVCGGHAHVYAEMGFAV